MTWWMWLFVVLAAQFPLGVVVGRWLKRSAE